VKLRIMGMPLSTATPEEPRAAIFEAEREFGFPIEADYKPLDSNRHQEFEQLASCAGPIDIIALRLGQVSRDEPTILGLD